MKKGERTKCELTDIAYRLFTANGYENTSVDEIIRQAGIAKGTFYYHYDSKDQILEDVIATMIESEAETAKQIVESDIPVPQKIVGVITSIKPAKTEQPIKDALLHPENALMHDKTRKKLIEVMTPLLCEVVKEGVKEGIFVCNNIPERVRMLLVISNDTFNEGTFTKRDIAVFVDMTEKLLGAKTGTMRFISKLIDKSRMVAIK